MSTQVTERTTPQESSGPPTVHSYPRHPRYRVSGMSLPQPGDIARCGWVKRTPPDPALVETSPTCVVCAELIANGVLP